MSRTIGIGRHHHSVQRGRGHPLRPVTVLAVSLLALPGVLGACTASSPSGAPSSSSTTPPLAPTPSAGAVIAWGSDENDQTNVPVEAQSGVTAIAVGGDPRAGAEGREGHRLGRRTIEGQATVPGRPSPG